MVKTKNKYEMNLVDEGYEDTLAHKIEEQKRKMKEDREKGDENVQLNLMTKKNMIIFVVWALLYRLFINWEFGLV